MKEWVTKNNCKIGVMVFLMFLFVALVVLQSRQQATVVLGCNSLEVSHLLKDINTWNFDINALEDVTCCHALPHVARVIFDQWEIARKLHTKKSILSLWVDRIESRYRRENPYHNADHAADVLQATSVLLNLPVIQRYVSEPDQVAVLLAAAAHDVDHRGVSNDFLAIFNHPFSKRHGNVSTNEYHHVEVTIEITENQETNIFSSLSAGKQEYFKQTIKSLILATDFAKHDDYIMQFKNFISNTSSLSAVNASLLVAQIVLKLADVSNSARITEISGEWPERVAEENFRQNELVLSLGLDLKGWDRGNFSFSEEQAIFIDRLMDGYETFVAFTNATFLVDNLIKNKMRWKEREWNIPVDNFFGKL